MAYVQRAFSKYKPATLVFSIEEREKAKATVFKLLQLEQFGEEIESVKAEEEFPKGSKILQLSLFLDEEEYIRAKGKIGKSQSIQYCYIRNIMRLNYSCEMSTRIINTKALSMLETLSRRRYLPRHTERPMINQEQVC